MKNKKKYKYYTFEFLVDGVGSEKCLFYVDYSMGRKTAIRMAIDARNRKGFIMGRGPLLGYWNYSFKGALAFIH
ncbi:MAG: hypothetical protein WBO49_04055, partial [Candidatus Saccharimonas sp.]